MLCAPFDDEDSFDDVAAGVPVLHGLRLRIFGFGLGFRVYGLGNLGGEKAQVITRQ